MLQSENHFENTNLPVTNYAYVFKSLTFSFTANTTGVMDEQTLKRAEAGDAFRLYAAGIIKYTDMFGEVHHTLFCYSLYGKGLSHGEPCPDPKLNYGD